MSVRVMSKVWESYPNGGGEMLLALALADHAHDDGTHIWPSVDQLAAKTRQSSRTVQYQLRNMREAGWLLLTNAGNGGRGMHSEYRISIDWIKGADFASLKKGAIEDEKGATDDQKGANDDTKGRNQLHPHITTSNRQEPSGNRQGSPAGDDTLSVLSAKNLIAEGVEKQHAKDWLTLRKAKRLPLTPSAWEAVKAEGEKVDMTPAEAVAYAVANNWAGFRSKWVENESAEKGKGGGAWWVSPETKLAKAMEVGVGPAHRGEPDSAWQARIQAAIDNGGKPPERARPMEAVTVRDPLAEEGKAKVSAENRAATLAAAGIRRPRPAGDGAEQGAAA